MRDFVAAPELPQADAAGVHEPDRRQVRCGQCGKVVAHDDAGLPKQTAHGLHMHAVLRRDLNLRLAVAVVDQAFRVTLGRDDMGFLGVCAWRGSVRASGGMGSCFRRPEYWAGRQKH